MPGHNGRPSGHMTGHMLILTGNCPKTDRYHKPCDHYCSINTQLEIIINSLHHIPSSSPQLGQGLSHFFNSSRPISLSLEWLHAGGSSTGLLSSPAQLGQAYQFISIGNTRLGRGAVTCTSLSVHKEIPVGR